MSVIAIDFAVKKNTYLAIQGVRGSAKELLSVIKASGASSSLEKGVITIKPEDGNMFLGQLAVAKSLTSDDQVILEMGAGADAFAVACRRLGAQVFRVPGREHKLYREALTMTETDSVALSLARHYLEMPSVFYPLSEKAQEIARVAAVLNYYYFIQKRLRIPISQKAEVIRQATYFLFEPTADAQMMARLLGETTLAGVQDWEAAWLKQLEIATKASPFVAKYLDPIPGLGPRIIGRIIASASDIRRFPNAYHFISYMGYAVFDGEAPRRRVGQTLKFNPDGQQGVWNYPTYVVKTPKNPVNAIYLARREHIAALHPDWPDGKIYGSACRYIGQRLLCYIHHAWWHYLGRRFDGDTDAWHICSLLDDGKDEASIAALRARWQPEVA